MVRPASAKAEKPKPLKEEVASCSLKIRFSEIYMIACVFGLLWHSIAYEPITRLRFVRSRSRHQRAEYRSTPSPSAQG